MPRPKYKFKDFVKVQAPLPESLKSKPKPKTPRGALLPNGFCVGDKVTYVRQDGKRRFGIVCDSQKYSSYYVWANWGYSLDQLNPYTSYVDLHDATVDLVEE